MTAPPVRKSLRHTKPRHCAPARELPRGLEGSRLASGLPHVNGLRGWRSRQSACHAPHHSAAHTIVELDGHSISRIFLAARLRKWLRSLLSTRDRMTRPDDRAASEKRGGSYASRSAC